MITPSGGRETAVLIPPEVKMTFKSIRTLALGGVLPPTHPSRQPMDPLGEEEEAGGYNKGLMDMQSENNNNQHALFLSG